METIKKASFRTIIYQEILPHLERLIDDILTSGRALEMDGVRVFEGGDYFVAGKIVNGASYVVTMGNEATRVDWLEKTKAVIDLTASMEMKTWGYLNYLMGLYRLKESGYLEIVLSGATLEVLKEKLDWRHFVDLSDLSLIHLPTNYYGVAYSVARYRELLGWDDEPYSQALFEQLLKHVTAYSGEYLFMDETKGEGRFDRYSILIPGEMASMLTSTNLEVPASVLQMLRKSSDICLQLANTEGDGISYGRSIGAYGDTAVLEVLSIAAKLGILTEAEKQIAYGYNTCVANKMAHFWMDEDMRSINMWEKGRRTDKYRHKGRILGENFSLSCQLLHTYHQWKDAGFDFEGYDNTWEEALKQLERYSYYPFAKGDYDRGLAIIRDGDHVLTLPIINGGGGTAGDVHGNSYFKASPYLPIPNENGFLETPSDTFYAQLTPKLILSDGTETMAISYIEDIQTKIETETFTISYHQSQLCMLGDRYPDPFEGIQAKTTYTFKPGCIEKQDLFYISHDVQVDMIAMDVLTYSGTLNLDGGVVHFGEGPIRQLMVEGLQSVSSVKVTGDAYHTPHQSLKTHLTFKTFKPTARPVVVKWQIHY